MVEADKKVSKQATLDYIDSLWESWFVKGLCDFIETPNLTPMVDSEYLTNGLVEKAIKLVDDYVNKLEIKGLTRQIF